MSTEKMVTIAILFLSLLLVALGHEIGGSVVAVSSALVFGFLCWAEKYATDVLSGFKKDLEEIKSRVQSLEVGKALGR